MTCEDETKKMMDFILEYYPDDIQDGETPVDVAIRLLLDREGIIDDLLYGD